MTKHCLTCTCETADQARLRLEAEQERLRRELREREFVQRHSVLTDAELDWARQTLASRS